MCDDLIVIFAGYEKEMEDFIAINPGIKSRIGYVFHFEDYSAEELLKIFETKMTDCKFVLEDEAKDVALNSSSITQILLILATDDLSTRS